MMKKFEKSELPKCDTETQSEQMLFENGADRLAQDRVAINLLIYGGKKKETSAKCNKVQ